MATIKDVAQLAGVSTATVSNYMNNTKPVSKAKGLLIEEAIKQLNYSENINAKNLKVKVSSDVGIVLPNLNDPYYVQIYQGIKSMFPNQNYFLNLAFTDDIPEMEQEIVKSMFQKRVCGLIIVSCCYDNWEFYHSLLRSHSIPLVLIDRSIASLNANYVSFNNRSNMRKLTDYVLAQNKKNPVLMAGSSNFTCENDCIKGFRDSLRENGIEFKESSVVQIDMNKENAFRSAISVLSRKNCPDAIITTSSALAAGVIEGSTILGFEKDALPIYTFGEEHWNLNTHSFAKNSIVRPALKLGRTASQLLLEELKDPLTKESERVILGGCSLRLSETEENLNPKTICHDAGEKKSIRVMLMDTSQSHSLAELLRNFTVKTGIDVQIDFLPHPGMFDTILREHAKEGKQQYDVFMYDIPWLPSLASKHVLKNLTGDLREFNLNTFIPGSMKYFAMYEGQLYGVPFLYAPQILYYRKDLFRDNTLQMAYQRQNNISLRPPVTLKEFNTVAEFFTNGTDAVEYGTTIPAAYQECLTPEIYMRLHSYGASIYDSEGHVTLNSEQALSAYLNLLRSVKYANPDFRKATDFTAVQDFIDGKIAMLITYPSFLNNISDFRIGINASKTIGYQMIPGKKPLLGGWGLGINDKSENAEEALEFIKWTCDTQIANYSSLLGGLSAVRSSYENDELNNLYPWKPLYKETFEHAHAIVPPHLSKNKIVPMHDIDGIVYKWVMRMLDQELSVQETISETHSELESHFKCFE